MAGPRWRPTSWPSPGSSDSWPASAGSSAARPSPSRRSRPAWSHSDFEAYVGLAGLIDPAAERKRLDKQIADKQKQLAGKRAKLTNEKFVANAPPEVVQLEREAAADLEKQLVALGANLAELGAG